MTIVGKTLVICAAAYHTRDIRKYMNLSKDSIVTVFGNPGVFDGGNFDVIVILPGVQHVINSGMKGSTKESIEAFKRYLSYIAPNGKVVDLSGITRLI